VHCFRKSGPDRLTRRNMAEKRRFVIIYIYNIYCCWSGRSNFTTTTLHCRLNFKRSTRTLGTTAEFPFRGEVTVITVLTRMTWTRSPRHSLSISPGGRGCPTLRPAGRVLGLSLRLYNLQSCNKISSPGPSIEHNGAAA
jgi:hypothetical protein